MPDGLKRCLDCHAIKPTASFRASPRSKDGLRPICFLCQQDAQLDKSFGPGAAEWWRWKMLEQGYKCARCGTDTPGGRGWILDHCHDTDRWRDVLCLRCNSLLGWHEDAHYDVHAFVRSLDDNPP